MAEVEMELDVSPHIGQEDLIDEDLIDYESGEDEPDQNLMSLDQKGDNDHQMRDEAQDSLRASGHDDEAMGMLESLGDQPLEDINNHDMVDFAEEPMSESLDLLGSGGHLDGNKQAESVEVDGLISYTESDMPNLAEPEDAKETVVVELEDSYLKATAPDRPSESGKINDAQEEAEEAKGTEDFTKTNEDDQNAGAEENISGADEVDEITWEEETVELSALSPPAEANEEAPTGSGPDASDGNQTTENNGDDAQSGDPKEVTTESTAVQGDDVEAPKAEDEEYLENEEEPNHSGEKEELQQENEEQEEPVNELDGLDDPPVDEASASTSIHTHVDVNPEYPSITVHYRGEEYPLFSQDVNGFFSDQAVMDYSINALLASFRAELQSEIEPHHDLVIQVDELGLEFIEAQTENDHSALTLRQILEVFELLIKNQDPDSTKTLYTYLTTRLNVNKRYEYLVDAATEGKGLDEVIHLFEPATTVHSQAVTENHTEDEQEHDIDGGTGEYDTSNGEFEEQAQEDEHSAENPTDHQNPTSGHVENGESYADLNTHETQDGFDDSHVSHGDDRYDITEEVPVGAHEDTVEADDDFDQAVSKNTGDDEIDEIDYEGADFPSEALDQINIPEQSNHSSTSHTVQDGSEEAPATPPAASGINGSETNVVVEQDEDDEFAEIDWRDEPDDTKAEVTTPSAGEKRNRDEVGAEVEDEQDVKRRRS